MSDRLSQSARQVVQAVQAAAQPAPTDRARGWELLQSQIPVDLGVLDPQGLGTGTATATKAAVASKLLGAALVVLAVAGVGAVWRARQMDVPAPALKPVGALTRTAPPSLAPPVDVHPDEPPSVGEVSPKLAPSFKAAPLGLAEDAELLYAARAAFQSGDLALASRKLQEHARAFPASQLSSARALLRVKVLCGLGQHRAALQEAERLRKTAPKSSEATGLASTCAAK